MAGELSLECLLNRDYCLVSDQSKLCYLLVNVKPSAGKKGGQSALNIGIVLDKSGSMYDENKLEFVQEAVKYVIDGLRDNDMISIIAFADEPKLLFPSGRVTNKFEVKELINRLENVEVGNGTEMHKAMAMAVDEIRKNYSESHINSILLLTDGQTTDEPSCKKIADDVRSKGIAFSTFGVGLDFNEALLLGLGQSSGGNSYYIDEPQKISQYFEEELHGLQSVLVPSARIELKISQDISIREGYRARPQIAEIGQIVPSADGIVSVEFSDIKQDEVNSLLFEILLPPKQEGSFNIVETRLKYNIPSQGIAEQTISGDVQIKYTHDNTLTAKVNKEVMVILDKVSIFKQQNEAMKLIKKGDLQKGTRKLEVVTKRLQEMGEDELAQASQEVLDKVKSGGQAGSAETKKLQYGTRKLTERLE